MTKCIQCGKELTTGDMDFICTACKEKNKETQYPPMMGWICPRCGTVHSPFVQQCGCPPPITTSTTCEINQ